MGKYCDEKRGRRRDERGWKERAEEERNCTARVSYRVITILGHFHPSSLPSPPPPPTAATLSQPATSSDIKLFIVHNGASSFVGSKKKYKWKKLEERTTPACGKGVLRQICRSSSRSSLFLAVSSHPSRCVFASFFFTANAKA